MIVALVGLTAVGKSDLAVELALLLDAEIVSADSMQIYRGMDIGTAKMSVPDRQGVPHHMLDVWDPDHEVSVVEFRDRARMAVDEVQSRGKPVIVVGGSWLYVQAILDELDFPGTDPLVRAQWEAELARVGPLALHARLREVDPGAATQILPTNGRRLVRALEVVQLQGSFTARLPEPTPWRAAQRIGLACDRTVLDARIEARVDRMWEQGLVEEVQRLMPQMGRTARGALGYRQVLEALEATGAQDAAMRTARQHTIDGTRRFARRQERRFRQDERVTWVPAGSTAAEVVARFDR